MDSEGDTEAIVSNASRNTGWCTAPWFPVRESSPGWNSATGSDSSLVVLEFEASYTIERSGAATKDGPIPVDPVDPVIADAFDMFLGRFSNGLVPPLTELLYGRGKNGLPSRFEAPR